MKYEYLSDVKFLKDFYKLKIKEKYVRINCLDFSTEKTIKAIEGRAISGSVNIDGSSSMRRTASLEMIALNENNINDLNNYFGIDKKVSLELRFKNILKKKYPKYSKYDYITFPLGVYVIFNANLSRGLDGIKINLDLKDKMRYYQEIGYDVYMVNSMTKVGFKEVEKLFTDKISVLSGQTGAGKSTFINALIPGFNLQTQEISQALGRGKHTTRCTELYQYNGGFIGDTPGFSKLDFSLILKEEIKDYFVEFKKCDCKFRDCLHDKELGCQVKESVNNGLILKSRYENYLKFLTDIRQEIKKY